MKRRWNTQQFILTVALVVIVAAVAACEKDEVTFPARNDDTFDPSHYVAIGNSLTAGFQGGGLEQKGQNASFPNLVAQTILGTTLQLPIVDSPGLGSEPGMTPLFVNEDGDITREALTVGTTDLLLNSTYPLPYDNLGVPGSTTRQMLDVLFADEAGNPFFDLVLRNGPRIALGLNGLGSQMGQLELLEPDVITAWTGNNEVLGGATSGSPQSADPNAPGYVVPPAVFETDFIEFCNRLEALNPKVVGVGNVPPVAAIPYTRFFGTGSVPGVNRWTMAEDLDGDDDNVQLVLLTAPIGDCVQCFLPSCIFNPATPCDTIPAAATLTVSEVQLINDAIAAYNTVIEREVTDRGWALVDINTLFLELPNAPGVGPLNVAFPWQVDPISGTGTKNETSAFTLDGIHPSEKGSARLANAFLEAFNATYGTAYSMYELAGIDNIAGFERAPAGKGVARLSDGGERPVVRFSEEARSSLTHLFTSRY